MLSTSRQERIAAHQMASRKSYVDETRARFAAQVPGEYRAHGIEELTTGKKDWGGSLDPMGALGLSRYLSKPTRFLLLTGPTGTGKSTAAFALADQLVKNLRRPARFVAATAMLTAFSFGLGNRSAADLLADFSESPILVIDDIGSANDGMTDHQKRSLWSLIDARWSNGRHTIITSNMSLRRNRDGDGLRDLLGESAWDRICDPLTHVEFEGESFRGSR